MEGNYGGATMKGRLWRGNYGGATMERRLWRATMEVLDLWKDNYRGA